MIDVKSVRRTYNTTKTDLVVREDVPTADDLDICPWRRSPTLIRHDSIGRIQEQSALERRPQERIELCPKVVSIEQMSRAV